MTASLATVQCACAGILIIVTHLSTNIWDRNALASTAMVLHRQLQADTLLFLANFVIEGLARKICTLAIGESLNTMN